MDCVSARPFVAVFAASAKSTREAQTAPHFPTSRCRFGSSGQRHRKSNAGTTDSRETPRPIVLIVTAPAIYRKKCNDRAGCVSVVRRM